MTALMRIKRIICVCLFVALTSSGVCAGEKAESLFQKGMEYYNANNFKKAISSFEKAIELDPNNASFYNALGLAHKEIDNNVNEVAWYFKVAIDIDPKFSDAYDNVGQLYYLAGKSQIAEPYLKKALALNPNLVKTRFFLAWTYLKMEQPQESIYHFREVLKVAKLPYAYFGLGMAYSMNNEQPMVLETITTLRGLGNNDLASQLESEIRKPLTPKEETVFSQSQYPGASGGQFPGGYQRSVPGQQQNPPPTTPFFGVPQTLGTMRVRLRGTMFSSGSQSPSASDTVQTPSRRVIKQSPPAKVISSGN